ncbi:MAG TPA: hypothetical protein VGB26_03785 [Nitrospiria bacterium]
MEILIFGNNKLEIHFGRSPENGLEISCKGNYILNYERIEQEITWKDLIHRTKPCWIAFLSEESIKKDFKNSWTRFKKELSSLVTSEGERGLLHDYFEICERCFPDDGQPKSSMETLRHPALIPQVWLNWIHFTPENNVRSKKVKQEPFQVDFVLFYSGRKIVMEIDKVISVDEQTDNGNRSEKNQSDLNLEKYTENLKKDRWLRRQGWEVWRFSEAEIKNKNFGLWGALQEMECEDLFF